MVSSIFFIQRTRWMVGLLSKRKTLEKAKSNLFSDVILVAECVFIDKSKLIQQLAIAV